LYDIAVKTVEAHVRFATLKERHMDWATACVEVVSHMLNTPLHMRCRINEVRTHASPTCANAGIVGLAAQCGDLV
jgi:hypothetical protein